jgi:HAD superfamily hydrolase (TIGR01509 family)
LGSTFDERCVMVRAMTSDLRGSARAMAPEHGFSLPDREFKGYIFDCDGTLADSMPLHFKAWRSAFAEFGAPFSFDWQLFMSRAGKTLEVTVAELNQQFATVLDPDRVSAAQRASYAALLPEVLPIVPVVELLHQVAAKFPVAVASGGDLPTVRTTLNALGVLDLFPVIVTAADVARGKPAPDMFLLAAERIGVEPRDCVVFEDSLLGIQAAEAAGMAAVLVRRLLDDPT